MKRNISPERRAQIGQEKRARTRSTILAAAFDLLGRERGRSTRIDEICQASGISHRTFYNYFSSTEELFDALTFEISHDFNTAVLEIISAMRPGAERTAAALRYYLHRTCEDRAWGWAMVNLSTAGPIFGAETFRHASASIQEGIDSKEFVLADPAIGRDLMMGAVLASMITLLRNDLPAAYPEAVVRQILVGLGVRPEIIEHCVSAPLPDPRLHAPAAKVA